MYYSPLLAPSAMLCQLRTFFSRFIMTNCVRRAFSFAGSSLCLELTPYIYATGTFNNCIYALSKDISIPADDAFSALETILLFNGQLSSSSRTRSRP